MAFVTKYQFQFKNDLQEIIKIYIQQKNGSGGLTQEYEAVDVRLTYDGDEGKDSCLIGASLEIDFDMRPDQVDYWNDLINAEENQWFVVAYNDTFKIFEGYVLPDEGLVPLQDKPYSAKITAVDGIGLLRDKAFIQPDHTNFSGINRLNWYIAAALQQTALAIPIRVYDNVFHSSMLNRDQDFKHDLFSQAYLEYRTFLKDATTFVSAYDALKIILDKNYRLFYYNGEWVIMRIALFQYWPFARYYTLYDYNGLNGVGYEELENYATVGKNELIYPINEDQYKYTKKAVKSVKTIFNYEPWPEIPLNNKFERGDIILPYSGPEPDSGDIDNDGDTTEIIGTRTAFTIDGWGYGTYSGFPSQITALPAVTANSARAYRKSVTNAFGVEIIREVILEEVTSGTRGLFICSEIPVVKGDKIKISFDRRTSLSGTGTSQIAMVFIKPSSGNNTYLESQNTNQMSPFFWQSGGVPPFISRSYISGENFNQYTSITIDPPEIPINGSLYIGYITPGVTNSRTYIKNFNVEYIPYVAGGYVQVKGEYHLRTQNKNYPDVSEQVVRISDNDHKVFKGCLLDANGDPFTRDWYRMGLSESRHYNELTNISWFNHSYRRFEFIEGAFNSLKCASQNNQENQVPIALHKTYRYVDMAGEDRRFIITPPMDLDLGPGWTTARYHEVILANEQIVTQKESIESLVARLRNEIDSTTESEWNSAGQAPASGTLGFPPQTYQLDILTPQPYKFMVYMNTDGDMTVSVQGDALISRQVNPDYNGYRVIEFTIDTSSYSVGDILTFTAYGHDVPVTVQEVEVTVSPDGEQMGDHYEFKYQF